MAKMTAPARFRIVRLMCLSVTLIGLKSLAESKIPTSGISKSSFEVLSSNFSSLENDSVNYDSIRSTQGFAFQKELGWPIGFNFGLLYYQNKNVKVNWKGTPDIPIEFYGYLVTLGLKASIPLPIVHPWVGAGFGWGVYTMSNPQDREFNNYLLGVYSTGSRSVKTAYGHGGLDIPLGGSSGFRLSLTAYRSYTDKSTEVGDQPYTMTVQSYGLGFYTFL